MDRVTEVGCSVTGRACKVLGSCKEAEAWLH